MGITRYSIVTAIKYKVILIKCIDKILSFYPYFITKARSSMSGHKKFDRALHNEKHNFIRELFWTSFCQVLGVELSAERVECAVVCVSC